MAEKLTILYVYVLSCQNVFAAVSINSLSSLLKMERIKMFSIYNFLICQNVGTW